ncbi:hypothetical protein BGZ73_004876 [Actinomortierella ambigua]|nr:hypothetical protein BGZ73_004876 [Actinomortierella ambigua]
MLSDHSGKPNPVILIPGLGDVRGELDNRVPVVRFLNVPFATMKKRWNPASPAEPWEGVRDATKTGFSPPQPVASPPLFAMLAGVENPGTYEERFSEKECLNLNIYMPDKSVLDSDEALPVMVWVYGGAFRVGGNGLPIYDCTNLVAQSIERKKPVVVVVLNYRVNYFGFLASKELKEEIDNDPSLTGEQKAVGNWGLQDQKLGFLWVRDHIAAFHGNKDDITAFGESAGSVSIAYHMMIRSHHGLFHRAILQSGGLLTLPTHDIENQRQKAFDALCDHVGIPKDAPGREKLDRLRAVPEKTIAEFVDTDLSTVFSPTVDGVLIDSQVHNWFLDASRLDPGVKKVLIGANRDEGTLFGFAFNLKDGGDWTRMRNRFCSPDNLDAFDKIYGRPADGDKGEFMQSVIRILTDTIFQAPISTFASMAVQAPHMDASIYLFDCEVSMCEQMCPGLGAAHGFDLLYLFDSPPCRKLLNEQEAAFAKEVRNVWLEFATTGSKAVVPVVRQMWSADEKNVIHLQRDFKVGRSNVDWLTKETFDYWARFFDYQLKRMNLGDFDSHGFKFGDQE